MMSSKRSWKLAVLFAALPCALLIHCGKTVDNGGGTSPDGGASSSSTSTSSSSTSSSSSSSSSGSSGSNDADTGEDVTIAPHPPVPCDAQDASVCDELPASICASSTTLLYFSDGTCVDGVCQWTANKKPCGAQSNCSQGGCTPPTTK